MATKNNNKKKALLYSKFSLRKEILRNSIMYVSNSVQVSCITKKMSINLGILLFLLENRDTLY